MDQVEEPVAVEAENDFDGHNESVPVDDGDIGDAAEPCNNDKQEAVKRDNNDEPELDSWGSICDEIEDQAEYEEAVVSGEPRRSEVDFLANCTDYVGEKMPTLEYYQTCGNHRYWHSR